MRSNGRGPPHLPRFPLPTSCFAFQLLNHGVHERKFNRHLCGVPSRIHLVAKGARASAPATISCAGPHFRSHRTFEIGFSGLLRGRNPTADLDHEADDTRLMTRKPEAAGTRHFFKYREARYQSKFGQLQLTVTKLLVAIKTVVARVQDPLGTRRGCSTANSPGSRLAGPRSH